jgi:alanyl-tRNA synthetase
MGKAYDELNSQADRVRNTVTQEEERFGETLDRGLQFIVYESERLTTSGRFPALRYLRISSRPDTRRNAPARL